MWDATASDCVLLLKARRSKLQAKPKFASRAAQTTPWSERGSVDNSSPCIWLIKYCLVGSKTSGH
jgi:hypothetical protein